MKGLDDKRKYKKDVIEGGKGRKNERGGEGRDERDTKGQ